MTDEEEAEDVAAMWSEGEARAEYRSDTLVAMCKFALARGRELAALPVQGRPGEEYLRGLEVALDECQAVSDSCTDVYGPGGELSAAMETVGECLANIRMLITSHKGAGTPNDKG